MSDRTLQQWQDIAMRGQADVENLRKRFQRDLADAEARTTVRCVGAFLPVADSLQRAAEHSVEGAHATFEQLMTALNQCGVHAYEPVGEMFDPLIHEAISTAPVSAGVPGTIVTCVQRGYYYQSTIIRAARVVVVGK